MAVGTVAAVVEVQFAAGVEVVADLQPPGQLGGEAEALEGQLVAPDRHIDIHGHLHPAGDLLLATDHHRVVRDLHRRGRQLADLDGAARHLHLAGDGQLALGQARHQVRLDLQLRIGLDIHRQTLAAHLQVALQALGPVQLAAQAALPLRAAAPVAAQLQALAGDLRLHGELLEAGRQLWSADLAAAQRQVAVDARGQQAAADPPVAVEAPGEVLDHRQERPRHRQVETAQAELTAERFARRARIELQLGGQLAQRSAEEFQAAVDALRPQRAVQHQAAVGKAQPLALLAHPQGAAAGVHPHLAIGTAGRQVELQVGVELAVPGEVVRQPGLQAGQREIAQPVAQARLRQQAHGIAAQAGRAGGPAMRTEVQAAVGQALQARRLLQPPVLATGLEFAPRQAAAPVPAG
ncbi:hypothetical protein D9M69_334700 [compost metagenome]